MVKQQTMKQMTMVGTRILLGVLTAAALVSFMGCTTSADRISTLESELSAAREFLEESQVRVCELEEQQAVAGDLAGRITDLDADLDRQVAMNTELRFRAVELEKLWNDSLSQSLVLSRQIYTLRKERDRVQQDRDDLYAKIHSSAVDPSTSSPTLSEVDVRIAELKGVCLYFAPESYAAKEAKKQLNQFQAHRLALLSPNPAGRRPLAPFKAAEPAGKGSGALDPLTMFRSLWADKLLPPER